MAIERLLDSYEPRIRNAFLLIIRDIISDIQIGQIIAALEAGNLQAAIDALYLDNASYNRLQLILREGYEEAGNDTINELGRLQDQDGNRLVFRFDVRNLAAEQLILTQSSRLITSIADETRQAARQHLQRGLAEGNNPRRTALDLVGRIDRSVGRRVGGIIGLSNRDYEAVERARQELEVGDYSGYLSRSRRDRRFDRSLVRAQREGRRIDAATVDRLITRYSDRLLELRGTTISRTETLTALHQAQYEALRQLVASGNVRPNQLTLIWDATRDLRTRNAHLAADGQMINYGEYFNVGGRQMRHPGDPAGGPENVINCRCIMRARVNFLSNVR